MKYCYLCFGWAVEEEWEEHCQKHLESLSSKRCGSFTYCHTLIRPSFCPFCVGDDQQKASTRLSSWTRESQLRKHVESHLTQVFWPRKCPFPLCDLQLADETSFLHHASDVHNLKCDAWKTSSQPQESQKIQFNVWTPSASVSKRKRRDSDAEEGHPPRKLIKASTSQPTREASPPTPHTASISGQTVPEKPALPDSPPELVSSSSELYTSEAEDPPTTPDECEIAEIGYNAFCSRPLPSCSTLQDEKQPGGELHLDTMPVEDVVRLMEPHTIPIMSPESKGRQITTPNRPPQSHPGTSMSLRRRVPKMKAGMAATLDAPSGSSGSSGSTSPQSTTLRRQNKSHPRTSMTLRSKTSKVDVGVRQSPRLEVQAKAAAKSRHKAPIKPNPVYVDESDGPNPTGIAEGALLLWLGWCGA